MFGVPKLLKSPVKAIGLSLIGAGINKLWDMLFPGKQWGIFMPGTTESAVEVSSVFSIDIRAEARVSDYPIQTGSFTTYNKMRLPNLFSVRITQDGDETKKAMFLAWLELNCGETSFFDVVTPDNRWPKSTLVSYRIEHSARSGATMLKADCVFEQIRELPAQFSNSKIAKPENVPKSPTARVNPQAGEPNSAGGSVSWQ